MSTGGTGTEELGSDVGSDPTSAQVEVAAETFRMLASGTRLRLVWTLVNQELDVSSLAEAIGAAVPTVSQHLAKMRLAGLISSRRDGRRIFYTVDDPHVVSMVREIFDHIAPDGSLAPDPPASGS
ncbi:metalloregulator ArsR/SmtB family transcription factor [Brevibacterium sp. RIT 803]|uniref:ArsR/SmtB family transcription factor n=1 Tax=Brevibacterium sp. RIT 803 TaxID=2810210 RepID=UPI0019517B85|nr:metalloregulator ArsR/SmtB family transcription factor [Brevibacterium sp. RIT 803]MBM6592128.1 helix-turn-helix transcriptional regulator [Brevibacterium sp. RIT 803]